jgi:hypothetical protein
LKAHLTISAVSFDLIWNCRNGWYILYLGKGIELFFTCRKNDGTEIASKRVNGCKMGKVWKTVQFLFLKNCLY